ncbi:ATP-binding protein [Akkermansiaceae bacterium]|nr:ATP-binding protein [Akkermansiaceae bacterium]
MNIKSIKIKNFRSIKEASIKFKRLNIFVGENDSGKSNVLRAIDLFFNEGRSYSLDWNQDFCAFAKVAKKKAPEIEIVLTLKPAPNFKIQDEIIWRKVWRQEGIKKDEMSHPGRRAVRAQTNKFVVQANRVRYDYVPAIKGEAYFSELLGTMYDMLERTVETQLRDAAGQFTSAVNSHTQGIIEELMQRLGLDSTIELPPDLRTLFERLDFRSTHQNEFFSLSQRGDGVKVRHVPIILRWLAKQAEVLKAPGSPGIISVWGYEEPENNLELSRCQKQAAEFLEDSERIQTFITTHSPAFYSIARTASKEKVALFGVRKENDGCLSTITETDPLNISDLDTSMGLMPLLAPHYDTITKEVALLREAQENLPDVSRSTIFVEGPTDKKILAAALDSIYPDLTHEISICAKNGLGGGHNWVKDQLIAWAHSSPQAVAVGIFDADKDALQSSKQVNSLKKVSDSPKVKTQILSKSPNLIRCFAQRFKVPFAIEEIFDSCWGYAEQRGWLEDRSGLAEIYPRDYTSMSFDQYLEDSDANNIEKSVIRKKIKAHKKVAFANYIVTEIEAETVGILDGISPTVEELVEKLGYEVT